MGTLCSAASVWQCCHSRFGITTFTRREADCVVMRCSRRRWRTEAWVTISGWCTRECKGSKPWHDRWAACTVHAEATHHRMPAAVQDLQRVDSSPPRAPLGPPVHPLPPQAMPRRQQPQKEGSSHQVVISGQQVLGAATSIISKAANVGSRAVSNVKSNVKSTLHTRVGGNCDAMVGLRLPLS